MRNKIYFLVILILALHLAVFKNLTFTAWPEMLSYPYLFNNGFRLYSDFIHPYPPALTFILSLAYKAFGNTTTTLMNLTWILILINDLLVFKLALLLSKNYKKAVLALLFYSLIQPHLDGNMLWFDTAITTPLLLSLIFWKKKNYSASLLSAFLAALIKQTAGLFWLALIALLIFRKISIKTITILLMPCIALGIFLFAYLFFTNSLLDFINWVFQYPLLYWSKFPGYLELNFGKRDAVTFLVLSTPFLMSLKSNIKSREYQAVIIFFLVSFVSIYPRFSYFHAQPLIAFASLFVSNVELENKKNTLLLMSVLLMFYFIQYPSIKYNYNNKIVRFNSKQEQELSTQITTLLTNEKKNIFLLNIHSGHYVYTNTLPQKPWVDNYGWYFEMPNFQPKVINSWEKDKPKYILVNKPINDEWYKPGTYQPKLIMEWIQNNYKFKSMLNTEIEIWQENQ